jgi:acetyltransferase-like isoleucine patch superfamily enzyme
VSVPPRLRPLLGRIIRRWRRQLNEWAIIGSDDREAATFAHFGFGAAILAPQGVMYNEKDISIGEGTMIGPQVTLTAGMGPGQEMLSTPVVTIGKKCIIGRGSHIIGHWNITLGDEIQTGPYVYITDQNHGYEDPDAAIGWQATTEKPVFIGSGSWLGTGVVILPGTHLGRNTVVAAGAVVSGTFPDHVVLGGVPARILRHYSADHGWQSGAPAS